MKEKLTFLVISLFISSAALNAQNLVVNGDFEDTSYSIHDWALYEEGCVAPPLELKGWDLKAPEVVAEIQKDNGDFINEGLNRWGGWGTYNYHTEDEKIDNDNYQFFHLQSYAWALATDDGRIPWQVEAFIQQTIPAQPATTYTFSFDYRLSTDTLGFVPSGFYAITIGEGAEQYYEIENLLDGKWNTIETSFNTTDDDEVVIIRLGLTAPPFPTEWNALTEEHAKYFQVDDVSLVGEGDPSALKPGKTATLSVSSTEGKVSIKGLTPGETVSIYTPAGNLMKSWQASGSETETALAPGVYILKAESGIAKILVK